MDSEKGGRNNKFKRKILRTVYGLCMYRLFMYRLWHWEVEDTLQWGTEELVSKSRSNFRNCENEMNMSRSFLYENTLIYKGSYLERFDWEKVLGILHLLEEDYVKKENIQGLELDIQLERSYRE